MPAAVEGVDDDLRDLRHLGLLLAQAVDGRSDVGEQAPSIEVEMVGGKGEIRAVHLQNVQEPVCELDVAVARRFCMTKRLKERLVPDPVELAGDGLEANVGHCPLPLS